MPESEALHASHVLEYPYSRSVGPVIGAFLTGLRDGKLMGVKGSGGSVIVPPTEYDPATGDDTGEMVEVGPGGVVESWAWVSDPLPKHPLGTPFAWALIRLDGADTAMLHAVDAGGPDKV
ncbi:MAG: Zn-ribbon domain-containing OB-fold protein, partial [Acidimicrobiales bacterium]